MTGPDAPQALSVIIEAAAAIADERPDAETNATAAGWDSLDMIELAASLGERLDVICTFEDVFDAANLGALAQVLADRVAADRPSP